MGKRWRDPAHPRPKDLEEHTDVWAGGRERKSERRFCACEGAHSLAWTLSVCYFRATRKAKGNL